MKGPEMKMDRMLGEPEGTLLDETGEMSQRDIEPGGEHYEWAQAIEAAAKEVERLTDGAFKFKEMVPFDKYLGPYARVRLPDGSGASLWDAQAEVGGEELYLDGPEYVGNVEELATALLGDEEAIRIVKARYVAVQEPTESQGAPQDEIEQAVDRMLEQGDTPVEEAGKPRTAPPPELSESVEAVGRFIAKAARTIKGLDHTYPELGFGDTPTDEEIADVFRRMLKGKRVRRPDYGFLYLGDEPSAVEKTQIAAATRKVTEILDALVIDIDDEMDVSFTPSIIDWLVEEFYGILHGSV